MATTWEEIQITCLQKIFSIDGNTLVEDSNTQPYLSGMPAAANEALQILCTAGRAFRKCLTIVQAEETENEEPKENPKEEPTEESKEKAEEKTEEKAELRQPQVRPGSWNGYDLRQAVGDFYILEEILLDDGERYEAFSGYRMEGDTLLLLPVATKGTFRVWYAAYPPKLTKDTPKDFVLELHPEEVTMLAIYMAGELYKDDDISIAQIYMNEFLTWLEELKESGKRAKLRNHGNGGGVWHSVKGWY